MFSTVGFLVMIITFHQFNISSCYVSDCNVRACRCTYYLRLIVVLNAHGEDINANDECDEKVQVVTGAQRVD